MISIDKCTGSCHIFSQKICVSKETKDIYVKGFNMATNKSEAKPMKKHISFDCKCKFNSTPCNPNQKWKIKHINVNVKIIRSEKKDYS